MKKVLVPLTDISQIKVGSGVVYKDANTLKASGHPVILSETARYFAGYLFSSGHYIAEPIYVVRLQRETVSFTIRILSIQNEMKR